MNDPSWSSVRFLRLVEERQLTNSSAIGDPRKLRFGLDSNGEGGIL